MDCPNHNFVSEKLSRCSVLLELGVSYIASPNRSGGPCKQCQKEWINGQPPTKDSLTTPMKAIVKANGKIEPLTTLEKAKSYVSAIVNWAFNGFANMPEYDYQRRVNCCRANTCGLYDKNIDVCNGCECVIQDTDTKKGKARYPLEMCPADLPEWKNTLGVEYQHQPNPGKCGVCGNK